MSARKYAITLLASGALLSTVAGCGTTHSASSSSSSAVVIALPVQISPDWFFPVLASSAYTDTNTQMYTLMYKPLVWISKSDGVDYGRSLASSIQSNANGTRYVIHLNPKWHWSNGTRVTASDVVFTWNIMKAASGNGNLPWAYGGAGGGGVPNDWTSVTAPNDSTVVVTLAQPANQTWFIHNGLGQIVPVPKAVWDKYPNNMTQELTWIKSLANDPTASPYHVVDGPYQFSKFEPNQTWSFVENPHYNGHKSSIHTVIFQYETSSASEFSALKEGTVAVGYLPASLYASRKSLAGDKLWPGYLWGFNMARLDENPTAENGLGPVFSQPYVRQALEMGINQEGIINSIYHGQGVVEDGPVPSEPPTKYFDPAISKPPYPFNPQAGKTLLESHGWTMVNGTMTNHGVKLAFPLIYSSGSISIEDTVELLKQDWAEEGIQITLVPETFDNLVATDHGNPSGWDAAYWGAGWTYQPDYYPTGGELFKTGAAANAGGYSNLTMNALINKSYEPGTNAETTKALFAYEAFAVKNVPYLWFPWIATLNESSVHLKGVVSTFNPIEDLMSPNYWTIK